MSQQHKYFSQMYFWEDDIDFIYICWQKPQLIIQTAFGQKSSVIFKSFIYDDTKAITHSYNSKCYTELFTGAKFQRQGSSSKEETLNSPGLSLSSISSTWLLHTSKKTSSNFLTTLFKYCHSPKYQNYLYNVKLQCCTICNTLSMPPNFQFPTWLLSVSLMFPGRIWLQRSAFSSNIIPLKPCS